MDLTNRKVVMALEVGNHQPVAWPVGFEGDLRRETAVVIPFGSEDERLKAVRASDESELGFLVAQRNLYIKDIPAILLVISIFIKHV
ncbi:MAG: hypothetical protein UT39_C0002G0090 [Candidatus Woesebacteria bacterium GW2011_GWA1_39_21]|uniref:Uncharacterized protein n=1 Tax=Candidatus Woesebacteria bacterium GW2011_GWA1_39_21 TaxID=1618550 RepID=A0A0G0N6U0_9BACT|nr:MAG: hypothetical protein UT39_C0002G0090 [Candidatus Woesebacteria bacterium GW2011_GWA1_39_21]